MSVHVWAASSLTLLRKANAPIIRTQSLKPLLRRLFSLSRNMHQKEYIPHANITQILQNFPSLRNTTDNRNLTQSSQGKHLVNFPKEHPNSTHRPKRQLRRTLDRIVKGADRTPYQLDIWTFTLNYAKRRKLLF